jgi:hypothetical protein
MREKSNILNPSTTQMNANHEAAAGEQHQARENHG